MQTQQQLKRIKQQTFQKTQGNFIKHNILEDTNSISDMVRRYSLLQACVRVFLGLLGREDRLQLGCRATSLSPSLTALPNELRDTALAMVHTVRI